MRFLRFSIGGLPGKWAGRVGDAPLPGCGGYATQIGGAAATGHGESIMKATVCKQVGHELIALKLSMACNNLAFIVM